MTLLEALSLGKRCVVTDVGGNPEVVEHGFNGFVTPSGDADAFARAILDTLASGHDQPNAGERIIDRWLGSRQQYADA